MQRQQLARCLHVNGCCRVRRPPGQKAIPGLVGRASAGPVLCLPQLSFPAIRLRAGGQVSGRFAAGSISHFVHGQETPQPRDLGLDRPRKTTRTTPSARLLGRKDRIAECSLRCRERGLWPPSCRRGVPGPLAAPSSRRPSPARTNGTSRLASVSTTAARARAWSARYRQTREAAGEREVHDAMVAHRLH